MTGTENNQFPSTVCGASAASDAIVQGNWLFYKPVTYTILMKDERKTNYHFIIFLNEEENRKMRILVPP